MNLQKMNKELLEEVNYLKNQNILLYHKNMTFNKLNKRVINWASEKGILKKATPLTQIEKTIEEVEETKLALIMKNQKQPQYQVNGKWTTPDEEIKDGIGDTLVTLLIQCKMQNLNPLDCLESALNIIENRTGKMINGQFVKDE